jgi:dienelactone hydrolase
MRLAGLLGPSPEPGDLSIRAEYDKDFEEVPGYRERRFIFTSEPNAEVPCILVTPKDADTPPPLILCIQGHSGGMKVSLGRWDDDTMKFWATDAEQDFAVQAAKQGFAALCIEMRAMGERADQRPPEQNAFGKGCHHAAMNALLLGRTMVGERVYDVSRAIDLIEELGDAAGVDLDRIACVGCSGGGMVTYYATCLEPRIQAAMPIGYVCTFEGCIGTLDHCACNYIPGIAAQFDMPDLAGMIAPAPLVIVSGDEDPIFPIHGVREAYATIENLYDTCGAPDVVRLVVGHGEHRQFADLAWPAFREVTGW